MSDWLKILISALAGVGVGVLLEPLKFWISLLITTNLVRNAIYRELGKSYMIFCIAGSRLDPKKMPGWHDHMIEHVNVDAFEYYYAQKRDAFYRLKEWGNILGLYRFVKVRRDEFKAGKLRMEDAFAAISGAVKDRVDTGGIDRKRIIKYAREYEHHVRVFLPPDMSKDSLIDNRPTP